MTSPEFVRIWEIQVTPPLFRADLARRGGGHLLELILIALNKINTEQQMFMRFRYPQSDNLSDRMYTKQQRINNDTLGRSKIENETPPRPPKS